MNTILDEIVAYKRKEIANRKSLTPTKLLEQSIYFDTPVVSLVDFLNRSDQEGIIAEFKRQSPSKGAINSYADVETVSIGYMQAGAAALSILTDTHFFGGKNEDLTLARKYNYAPILNKNFVIDEYQIIEAKSIGADAVLLIAECLTKKEINQLASLAKRIGLEVLLELHTADQLDKIDAHIDLVGVNNRNLKTFEVDIEQSLAIAEKIPTSLTKVAESGIRKPSTIIQMRQFGFKGFLIGELFMQEARPEEACLRFIQQLKKLRQHA